MTEPPDPLGGVGPGLLLVVADGAAGWLLYEAVAPAFGIALWLVAALVTCGLLAEGVGRSHGPDERSVRGPTRR